MKKSILTIIMLLVWGVASAQATSPMRIPADPNPAQWVQPDGDTLTVRLFGDEHKHIRTTIDGYVVVEATDGYLYYGKIKKKVVVASKYKAHDPEKRTKKEICRLRRIGKNKKLKIDTNNPIF